MSNLCVLPTPSISRNENSFVSPIRYDNDSKTFYDTDKEKNSDARKQILSQNNHFNMSVDLESKIKSIKKFIIDELKMLQADWDGYDALPIYSLIIDHALNLIDRIAFFEHFPLPEITPLPNGTVSMEWEICDKIAYIEIGNTTYSGFIKIDDKKPILMQGESNSINIQSIYSYLFSDYSYSPNIINPVFLHG